MKLGSLFDGSGTCPLAAQMTGFKPIWASEIEPFPIVVTQSQFPKMKHLGDITKIDGSQIEPVDFITFGSPCQDLSVAGKRAGLNGARSGLFMEAVRIIKEMRGATNGRYPQIAMWENVPGAFSSNKGEDFQAVLEELCKICDPTISIPRPTNTKGKPRKWEHEGFIVADGFSIAWRLLDAQFWGVPQRRKRIFLVADFGGQCAGQILFECEGLSRDFRQSREKGQNTRPFTEKRIDEANRERERVISVENHPADSRVSIIEDGTVQTLTSRMGTGGGNVPLVMSFRKTGHPRSADEGQGWERTEKADTLNVFDNSENRTPILIVEQNQRERERERESSGCGYAKRITDRKQEYDDVSESPRLPFSTLCNHNEREVRVMSIDRAAFNQGKNAKYDIGIDDSGKSHTLVAKGPGAVAVFWNGSQTASTLTANNAGGGQRMPDKDNFNCVIQDSVVRRLTPLECCRLQGMPDWWCSEVPHKDAPEYKMWGNGMALPNVLFVFEGVRRVLLTRYISELLEAEK